MRRWRWIIVALGFIALGYLAWYIRTTRTQIDTVGPTLKADTKLIKAKIDTPEADLTKHIKAEDDVDGDVSDTVLIERITRRPKDGDNEFTVSFAGFDRSGNNGRLDVNLQYTDYRKPHFSVTSSLRFPAGQRLSLYSYVRADDCIDGDITPFLNIDGIDELSDELEPGTYNCTVTAQNSVGDTATLPLNIEVYENTYEESNMRPSVVLTDYLIYTKAGETVAPTMYLDHVVDGGYCMIDFGPMVQILQGREYVWVTEKVAQEVKGKWVNISKIEINSTVDEMTPGTYYINYYYMSEDSGYDCTTRLTVIVE